MTRGTLFRAKGRARPAVSRGNGLLLGQARSPAGRRRALPRPALAVQAAMGSAPRSRRLSAAGPSFPQPNRLPRLRCRRCRDVVFGDTAVYVAGSVAGWHRREPPSGLCGEHAMRSAPRARDSPVHGGIVNLSAPGTVRGGAEARGERRGPAAVTPSARPVSRQGRLGFPETCQRLRSPVLFPPLFPA